MKKSPVLGVILVVLAACTVRAAEKPVVLDVWPGAAPDEKGELGEEKLMPPKEGETSPVQRLTNYQQRRYAAIDEVDRTSCRPDFAVLVYPAYLVQSDQLSPTIPVTAQTPPTFFVHAGDDRINSEGSVRMYLALKLAGVPADLHVFATGGHGFGLRPSPAPCSGWPRLCQQWMKTLGLLDPADRQSLRDQSTRQESGGAR